MNAYAWSASAPNHIGLRASRTSTSAELGGRQDAGKLRRGWPLAKGRGASGGGPGSCRPAARAPVSSRNHALCSGACQTSRTRQPCGRSAARTFASAATRSEKNIAAVG